RQELLPEKRPTWAARPLKNRSSAWTALPQGSVGQVLFCSAPWSGLSGAALVWRSFIFGLLRGGKAMRIPNDDESREYQKGLEASEEYQKFLKKHEGPNKEYEENLRLSHE